MDAVDEVSITTVVDNFIDATVISTDTVDRFDAPRHMANRQDPTDRSRPLVQAEHGISILVEWARNGESGRILFDTGWTPEVLLNNLEALEVDPGNLDAVVISHGHIDHHGGLYGLLEEVPGLPVHTSFEGFSPKWIHNDEGEPVSCLNRKFDRGTLSERATLHDLGPEGSRIAPGIHTTGTVTPEVDYEPPVVLSDGPSGIYRQVDGDWENDDPPRDEQALVINLRGRGLVLVAGCSHPGIISMIKTARDRFDSLPLHGLIGGFHTGAQPPDAVDQTLEDLANLEPDLISPMHCSGHSVVDRMNRTFPDSTVLNMVGTRFTLDGEQVVNAGS